MWIAGATDAADTVKEREELHLDEVRLLDLQIHQEGADELEKLLTTLKQAILLSTNDQSPGYMVRTTTIFFVPVSLINH